MAWAVSAVESLEVRRFMSASLPKLGGVLGYLANDFSTRPAARQSRAVIRNRAYTLDAAQPNASLLVTVGDTVSVTAVSKVAGTSGLADQITALGATVTARFGRTLSALVPVSALSKIEGLSYAAYAKPGYKPYTKAGKTDDYGVQALAASAGGSQYNVTGAGVTVGILSDSYSNIKTPTALNEATGVAAGDLPSNVNVVRDLTTADGQGTGEDEGRAMAEIVHDVAPDAGIAFYTADISEAGFATGILTLARPTSAGGAGAKVVVDDVGYLDEPYFQDGVIAQAVTTAANSYGTSYFSAAGNSGRQSYESVFTGVNASVNALTTISATDYPDADRTAAGTFQDWDRTAASDIYQKIVVPAGGVFTPSYQWDQPSLTASTNAGGSAGSADSVSIYLLNSAKTAVVGLSSDNAVGRDPVQIAEYDNSAGTSAVTLYMVAKVLPGTAAPTYSKYIDYGDGSSIQYATNSGTSIGHAVAPGGQGVGAAPVTQTPTFNKASPVLETYSSAGGVPIFFNPNGTRLTDGTNVADGTHLGLAQVRQQPAITSVDGEATSFFGSLNNAYDVAINDSQFHFNGTSAAAPHAAAVAALLLQAKPTLTNTQVYAAMQSTALDIGPAGFDYDSGYGLIQADKALASVAASSISGVSFQDGNRNGVKDASEAGLSGVTVFLDSNNNGVVDSGTGTAGTAAGATTAIPDATSSTVTYEKQSLLVTVPSRVASTIATSFAGRVTGLTVSIAATSTRAQQLGFTLITPHGIRIPLLTAVGGAAATTASTGLNITLSDTATSLIQSQTAATGTRTGTFKPQTLLSAAVGENATGTWQLESRDYRAGVVSTLTSWSLGISYAETATKTDASGNYAFNGLTPSEFYGTYRVRQLVPAGLTPGTPTSPYDLTIGRGTTTAGQNFGAFAPVSTVASVVLDDGTAQRSRIRGATVTFNGTIPAANIAAGAFTLTQTSGVISPYTVSVASVTTPAAGQTVVRLTFGGAAVVGGSVADGRYTLAIDGSKIVDSTGLAVDALSSGVPGSVRTLTFGRIYGDIDGDGGISIADFNQFAAAFASVSGKPQYVDAFDYDGDAGISIADFNAFAGRFGQLVP